MTKPHTNNKPLFLVFESFCLFILQLKTIERSSLSFCVRFVSPTTSSLTSLVVSPMSLGSSLTYYETFNDSIARTWSNSNRPKSRSGGWSFQGKTKGQFEGRCRAPSSRFLRALTSQVALNDCYGDFEEKRLLLGNQVCNEVYEHLLPYIQCVRVRLFLNI